MREITIKIPSGYGMRLVCLVLTFAACCGVWLVAQEIKSSLDMSRIVVQARLETEAKKIRGECVDATR